jgi:hypothetical protein
LESSTSHRPERIAVVDYYLGVIDVMQWIPDDHELAGQSVAAVYGFLAAKYLRPRSHIKTAVDAFYRRHIAGTRSIAVHVRGLDKKFEDPELYAINARYFDILDEEDPSWRILLLTDDEIWADAFRKRYGERVVMTDSQRTTGDVGIHYSSASSIDRTRLGYEVMRDTYLALRCDKFLGNGRSNLSAIVEVSKRWDSGACRLLVPSQLLNEPNLSVSIHHRPPALAGQAPTIDASYRLGDEIDFSNPYASRPFMQSGWSLSESWGVWTLGSVAELRLHPTIETDRPLILRADVRPFLAGDHDQLSVRVACCGEDVAEWVFALGPSRKRRWCMAQIPSARAATNSTSPSPSRSRGRRSPSAYPGIREASGSAFSS